MKDEVEPRIATPEEVADILRKETGKKVTLYKNGTMQVSLHPKRIYKILRKHGIKIDESDWPEF